VYILNLFYPEYVVLLPYMFSYNKRRGTLPLGEESGRGLYASLSRMRGIESCYCLYYIME